MSGSNKGPREVGRAWAGHGGAPGRGCVGLPVSPSLAPPAATRAKALCLKPPPSLFGPPFGQSHPTRRIAHGCRLQLPTRPLWTERRRDKFGCMRYVTSVPVRSIVAFRGRCKFAPPPPRRPLEGITDARPTWPAALLSARHAPLLLLSSQRRPNVQSGAYTRVEGHQVSCSSLVRKAAALANHVFCARV